MQIQIKSFSDIVVYISQALHDAADSWPQYQHTFFQRDYCMRVCDRQRRRGAANKGSAKK
jgi:hypothetical protein